MVSTGVSHPDITGTLGCSRCQKKSKAQMMWAVRILASGDLWGHLKDSVHHIGVAHRLQCVLNDCLDGQTTEFSEALSLELFLNKAGDSRWNPAVCFIMFPAIGVSWNAL